MQILERRHSPPCGDVSDQDADAVFVAEDRARVRWARSHIMWPVYPGRHIKLECGGCGVSSELRDRGRFVKGSHWRKPKVYWNKSWLEEQYVELKRSAASIAEQSGCTENNILFWLAKHQIPRRDMKEIRGQKRWGASGPANPMYGRTGSLNPRYVDGSAPERQRLYVQSEGRGFLQKVYARDGFSCVRCGAPKKGRRSIHAHHIRPWAGNPDLRFDLANAVTLCRDCHHWIHSKANVSGEYIA